MSRFNIRASCSTKSTVNFLDQVSKPYDPENLTVFVGEKNIGNQYSLLASSGGLLAPQHFTWENFPMEDLERIYIDPSSCSITLDMELSPVVGTSNSVTGTFAGDLPADSMAINLSTKFGQGAADAFMDEDVWAKLVYYDTGRLGRGVVFNPNSYIPSENNKDVRGIYVLGGGLPDYSDSNISVVLQSADAVRLTPSVNFQVGRDLSFISQALDTQLEGISGYWSLGYEPIANTMSGNSGGKISQADDPESKGNFKPWLHFGTPTVGYPSALDTTAAVSSSTALEYWQAVNPIYGRPASEGVCRPGNCLPIRPSIFMTNFGLKLLTAAESNPGGSTAAAEKVWSTYFTKSSTDKIRLTETQPFRPACPFFDTSMNIMAIPNVEAGLDLLVPVTRVCNGVLLYTPISCPNIDALTTQAISMDGTGFTSTAASTAAKKYYNTPSGLLYVWFTPTAVKMSVNFSAIRLEDETDVTSYFNQAYYTGSLYKNAGIWLRWYLNSGEQLSSTISTLVLNSNQLSGPLSFTLTTRKILERLNQVLAQHKIASKTGWGVSELSIKQIAVSCSTKAELYQLYSTLLPSATFKATPQGAVLAAGGAKVFTRLGNNLGCNSPMFVRAEFIGGTFGELDISTGIKNLTLESIPAPHNTPFSRVNDFITFLPNTVDIPNLRIPSYTNISDDGGILRIEFSLDQYLNMPWSGPSQQTVNGGGPSFKLQNFASAPISSSTLAGYEGGWFNKLNPFSQDYNKEAVSSGTDKWPDLDSRMVDFNRRSVELWVQVSIDLPIYSGNLSGQNTTTTGANSVALNLWSNRM